MDEPRAQAATGTDDTRARTDGGDGDGDGGFERAGVIGQGTMGSHFRDCLLAAGYDVTAFDVDDRALADAREAGAGTAADPAALARAVDAVVISVPGDPYVEAVMESADGVLAGLADGGAGLVIDVGTTRPHVDAEYARQCRQRGAGYLDAPVTWTGPTDGVNTFVGGEDATVEDAAGLLEAMSGQYRHYGGVGAGQVVKAGQRVEQMFHRVTHTEVVEFLRNNGVDPAAVNDQLDWGLGEGYFRFPLPVPGGLDEAVEAADVEPGYGLDEGERYHLRTGAHKDIQYALDIAHSSATATPLLAAAYEAMKQNARYRRIVERLVEDDWSPRTGQAAWRLANRPEEAWLALLDGER